jgi:hypothetical protein
MCLCVCVGGGGGIQLLIGSAQFYFVGWRTSSSNQSRESMHIYCADADVFATEGCDAAAAAAAAVQV